MDKTSSPDQVSEPMPVSEKEYIRFDLSHRLEHLGLLIPFTILGITGLAQKYATSPLGEGVIALLGGIEASRFIHRISAIALMLVSIYHILAVLYRVLVLRAPLNMLPLIEDFWHLIQDVTCYLGLKARRAYYGRYSYAEKVEYLAVVWGTAIMAITGFMMWNPIATARWLPGEFIPAAKAAHGAEAILAVLAIILWHFYHVHVRHFNKSMFNGKITASDMRHEHPAELAQIEAGETVQRPPAAIVRRRQKIFVPVAMILSAVFLFGVNQFVAFEQTAINTVPKGETAQIFVPVTSTPAPTPTALPSPTPGEGVRVNSWEGSFGSLLNERCGACHAATKLGGLDLTSYPSALQGGVSGPAVVPGDPDSSLLVQKQSSGNHPGQLTIDELETIIEWIKAGAAEK